MRRTLVALSALLMAVSLIVPATVAQEEAPPLDGRYQGDDDAGGFFNIMPPGQDGVLNTAELTQASTEGSTPEHFNDQTGMYENLVYEGGLPLQDGSIDERLLGITDGDIERFFKDGSFGASGEVVAIAVPEECGSAVAFRDTAFGVPHIYGETREAAQCANGWATAEDRLFLMDLLRHIGYARMSEFLGASEANKAMDRGQLLVAPYDAEDFAAQESAICDSRDAEFQQICADGQAYIQGVNLYIAAARQNPALLPGEYPALQVNPEDFVLQDIIATASLVGGIFGKGGGNEATNSMFMATLIEQHGEQSARAIFDDLKAANDPDASLTTPLVFPYNVSTSVDDDTTALLKPGSLRGAFDEAGGDQTPLSQLGIPGSGVPATMTAENGEPVAFGVVDGPFGPIDLRVPYGMSNAILATAEVTDSGKPIAVFGPQTGYYTPQLLVETDLHAPGLDARGTAFAGTNIYVQLGRGNDYAWSATSASADLVDEWALELCDPEGGEVTIDSPGYVWNGQCDEIPVLEHTQIAKPSAGGTPASPAPDNIVFILEIGRIPELGNAPVVGRALTTDGTPVAIAEQRTTLGSELRSALGFKRVNDPTFMTDGQESFNRAFDGVDYTFNWFYVDDTDIAYRHTCLCPIRDGATDPDLLSWGGRGNEWTGEFLPVAQQPQEVNPPSGFFANWNNKQAPGFRSQDDTWKHHSTDRREHLAVRMEALVEAGVPLTRGDMVNVAEDAGTVDTNPQEIYPLALEIMGEEAPEGLGVPAATLEAMHGLLAEWIAVGGHRRDLDRDGVYDNASAVALGDVWLRPMLDAVIGDEVPLVTEASASSEDPDGTFTQSWPEGVEDHPRGGIGSAYNSGRVRFLQKDFWQVLDRQGLRERSRTYCADGTREGCAEVLWQSLAETLQVLETAAPEEPSCAFPEAYHFGSATPSAWLYNADCDNIVQGAAGVVAAPSMRWVNRPTFHQVVEVGADTGRIAGSGRVETAAAASRHAFPEGSSTVVLASAGTFADAVTGTPLAASRNAPVLLTSTNSLSSATEREILRLGATDVIVLGGTAAIAEPVVSRLDALGIPSTRLSGDDRFGTSLAIADAMGQTDRFVLADGGSFADALAAGPFAAVDDRAIVLTNTQTLPADVADVLAGATDIVIAGGTAAVSAEVATQVAGNGITVTRVAGDSRYSTAAEFTARTAAGGADTSTTYAVTGENFPDALSAGAVAARTGGVLVLLNPAGLDLTPEAARVLSEEAQRVWLVGGTAPLPSALRQQVEAARG